MDPSASPIIQVKNLTKSYGQNVVLRGISFEVKSGEVIGYIGPNGAGKSTTVRLICGLDDQFGGEILVNGLSIIEKPLEIKKMIGYIPELSELYEVLTPKEYLHFIGRLHHMDDAVIHHKSLEMLRLLEMDHAYKTRMDSFSKGMKQKVLICSGLIHDPQIIFFDEPLSGLDANSVMVVKEIIARFAQLGKTIFYCSHMMDIVERVSDRIILINEGKIVANAPFAELKSQHASTLESLFANLTGQDNHAEKAAAFVEVLSGS